MITVRMGRLKHVVVSSIPWQGLGTVAYTLSLGWSSASAADVWIQDLPFGNGLLRLLLEWLFHGQSGMMGSLIFQQFLPTPGHD